MPSLTDDKGFAHVERLISDRDWTYSNGLNLRYLQTEGSNHPSRSQESHWSSSSYAKYPNYSVCSESHVLILRLTLLRQELTQLLKDNTFFSSLKFVCGRVDRQWLQDRRRDVENWWTDSCTKIALSSFGFAWNCKQRHSFKHKKEREKTTKINWFEYSWSKSLWSATP